ncbi:hypothetical protein D1007_45589 [Hordeum vulgare]|nr:hypothetical protein D1007_45589 [Hordeum vulgare]
MFPSSIDESVDKSKCESNINIVDIMMADTARGEPPRYSAGSSRGCDRGGRDNANTDAYVPQPLGREQEEDLGRRKNQVLLTPITGTTPKEMALEAMLHATLT